MALSLMLPHGCGVLVRSACFGKVRPAERVDLLVVVSIGLLQMMLFDGHGRED